MAVIASHACREHRSAFSVGAGVAVNRVRKLVSAPAFMALRAAAASILARIDLGGEDSHI